MISLVYAVSENDVIGQKGGLPWRLPADMKRFKSITWGGTVVMGRKTYESIGCPLAGRKNIVLSKKDIKVHCDICTDYIKILDIEEDVFIIGGREIYELFLPYAGRIYQTRIEGCFDGDVIFSQEFLNQGWRLIESEKYTADDENEVNMYFNIYERVIKND